jgi:hypothetical protein
MKYRHVQIVTRDDKKKIFNGKQNDKNHSSRSLMILNLFITPMHTQTQALSWAHIKLDRIYSLLHKLPA